MQLTNRKLRRSKNYRFTEDDIEIIETIKSGLKDEFYEELTTVTETDTMRLCFRQIINQINDGRLSFRDLGETE